MEEEYVEAIDEGKIVKVAKSYAKREGLPILRKSITPELHRKAAERSFDRNKTEKFEPLDTDKHKFNWRREQVTSELVDHFSWLISQARRRKGLTRKQLALAINEKESAVRMIEYGTLPKDDFVIINKIQSALGINLRKDKRSMTESASDILKKQQMYDDEIELIEDEKFE